MTRATENDVAQAVLAVLETLPKGRAHIREIKQKLPDFIRLTPEDRTKSATRPGEEIWEQQVRNIVSHRGSEGNFINDGLLAYWPKHLGITKLGLRKLGRLL